MTHYVEAGNPDGEPVILLHDGAWGGYGLLSWEPVLPFLEERWRLLLPDMLGFGKSDKAVYLDRPPYWPRVRQVTAFARELDLHNFHVVGTSFGGSVALRGAASREWNARTITSIGGGGGPWRSAEGIDALTELIPGREFIRDVVGMLVSDPDSFPTHIDNRLAASMIPGHYACLASLRLRHPGASDSRPEDPYPADLVGLNNVYAIEMDSDRIMNAGWSDELRRIAPNVNAISMSGAHSPNLENPSETAAVLESIFTAQSEKL